ncbi:hypothetical protein [Streptomyces sp. NPDC050704]|uniref:hypothetical protein n=1 Tax=Streptomyces sp. NPDC050704 TaxID=3157219 RepID=UPI00343A9CD6
MSFLIASGHVSVEARTDKAMRDVTALIGAMGALGPATAVAGAGVAAAGVGVLAFGVAAGKQVLNMAKATQAQNKYKDAVAEHGRASKKATDAEADYQRVLAKQPAATREATAAWSALGAEYTKWSDSLAGDTMPVFTKSFGLFQAMLPKTSGLVRGTSAELDRFLTLVAGEVASPGFDRVMDDFTDFAVGSLRFGLDGILKLSSALANFGADGGFDAFIDNARETGPLLGETLTNLAKAVLNLTVAGGDLGISMLTAANALAEMVNAIPPEVLGTILQLYAGLKLLSMGMAAMTAIASVAAIGRLRTFFAAVWFAGFTSAAGGALATMTRLQKVALGLGVLGVVAFGISKLADKARGAPPDVDRLTTSLKQLAATGKFSGELQKTFGDMDGLVAKVRQLDTETKKASNTAFGFRIPLLDDAADSIAGAINDMSKGDESLNALKDDFKSLDAAMSGMVSSGFAPQAARDFNLMRDSLKEAGYSTKEINALFPEYRASVAGLKEEQRLAAAGMGLFGAQAMATKTQLDAQKQSAEGLRASIMALNDVNRSAYDAQIGFEQSLDALTASFKEHGASLNLDTEAGQKNGQAMSAAAKAHDEMLAAGLAAGESLGSMTAKSDTLRTSMMRLAVDAFDGNKQKATEYVNKLLGMPGEIKTAVKLERTQAIAGLKDVQAEIRKTPGAKSVKVDTLNAAAIKALESVGLKTRQLPDGRTEVYTKNGQSIGSIGAVSRALANLNGKTATTWTYHNVKTTYINSLAKSGQSVHDAVGATGGRFTGSGFRTKYGTGGKVKGPGTGTSDDVFAPWLSNDEWVIKAASVAKYGDKFMASVNDGTLKLGPQMAKGGKLSAKQKKAQEAAKKQAAAEKTGKNELADAFGISHFGTIAKYKRDPFEKSLAGADSLSDLVSNLNKARAQIKAASHGKTESTLLKRLDSSGKALIANQRKLDGVNKALDGAKNKLDDLKGKFDSLKTSVSSSLVGFANITKIGKYGTSAETLINQLRSDTTRTTEFSKQLEQLKAKGLNAQSISEIAQAGVTGGGMSTAQSLLNATPQQIAEINALEAQLKKSADAAGATTANAMYGAGIKASEGLVKGLTAQQDKIEAAMMKIAKAMEASIKKALGIKSPAARMVPIGDYTFQGVEQGWAKRMARGNTLLSGSAAGLRLKPAVAGVGAAVQAPAGPSVVVHLNPAFSLMTLPSPTERKAFVKAMVKDINDELLDFQKQRRR